eukprot:UN15943
MLGSETGSNVGSELGSTVGSMVGSQTGSNVGSNVGFAQKNRNTEEDGIIREERAPYPAGYPTLQYPEG